MDHIYRFRERKYDILDKFDYEISSVLLELSNPVVFSSDSPFLPNWGRTKRRTSSIFIHLPKVLPKPMIKSMPVTEVGEIGSTSSSSCLTGEAKKINRRINKKEFATIKQKTKPEISSFSAFEAETGLLRAQVGFVAQPIAREDQNHLHFQPLISADQTDNIDTELFLREARDNLERSGIDLNLPAAAEGNRVAAMDGFERVTTKVKAAQARQKRLGLIRSKKLYSRFISPYHFK